MVDGTFGSIFDGAFDGAFDGVFGLNDTCGTVGGPENGCVIASKLPDGIGFIAAIISLLANFMVLLFLRGTPFGWTLGWTLG